MSSNGGERERVIASEYTRQAPERVRHDAKIACCRSAQRIERFVVVAGPRRHDECPVRTDGGTERLDQPGRSTLDRP